MLSFYRYVLSYCSRVAFLQVSAVFSRFFVAGCFACASDSFELVYWGTDFSVGV